MSRRASILVPSLLLVLSLELRAAASAAPRPISAQPLFAISPAPSWTKPIPAPDPRADQAEPGGISYLLIDRQESVQPPAHYRHEARQITSDDGVQNGAAISVSFDPSYQKLVFHSITLRRGAVNSNRLDRANVKLLQRERDMERYVYDGAFTAQCDLDDVRVGDVIEFAYTVEGANPVKSGRFSSTFSTQWPYSVRRVVARLVYPTTRKIYERAHNRELHPTRTQTSVTAEWLLDEADVPGKHVPDDTPADYDPRGWVEFSEFDNWQDVVAWALPLFFAEGRSSRDLDERVEQLNAITDPERRILAALHFVQDEVRYLGNESGVSSHRPTAATEVLRRRFGDCKDKVLLLTTLLRRSGITAVPALVSTTERAAVKDRLPSPDAFDHVVVQVSFAGSTYWLDATRTNQRGPIGQLYITAFGNALVLDRGVSDLSRVAPAPGSFPRKRIVDSYTIPAPGGVGELAVVTDLYGEAADRMRGLFRERGRDAVQKDYLQYYTRRFPEAQIRKPLEFAEVEGENACRISEFYCIPNIWELNKDQNGYEVALYPGEIDQAIGTLGAAQRDDPLALDYPRDVVEQIDATMFGDWEFPAASEEVGNVHFRYRTSAIAKQCQLTFQYSYETLVDRVSATDVGKFTAAAKKVKDSLGYVLRYKTPAQLEEARAEGGLKLADRCVAVRRYCGGECGQRLVFPLLKISRVATAHARFYSVRRHQWVVVAGSAPPDPPASAVRMAFVADCRRGSERGDMAVTHFPGERCVSSTVGAGASI